jgi:hypothetical protein
MTGRRSADSGDTVNAQRLKPCDASVLHLRQCGDVILTRLGRILLLRAYFNRAETGQSYLQQRYGVRQSISTADMDAVPDKELDPPHYEGGH